MQQPPSSDTLSRRGALKTLGASAAFLGLGLFGARSRGFAAAGAASAAASDDAPPQAGAQEYPFALPPLGFDFGALEPHIDARTMEIHYTKHHQAYVTNANKALEAQPALRRLDLDALLRKLGDGSIEEPLRTTLRNNAGGHANHTFFWRIIAPRAGGGTAALAQGGLLEAIKADFGSFDSFKARFADAAMKRFGSGWAWLVVSASTGRLGITSSANQDSPLLTNDVPVLGIDVWEHAYYLKYQNRRADYIDAFWNVVNWSRVAEIHTAAVRASRG